MNRPLGRTKAKDNHASATSKAKVKVRTADAAALALGLERSSNEPRHVRRQLRHMILSGRVTPAARLPSTRAVASELGVSRATSVLAFDQLVSEGYLEGR